MSDILAPTQRYAVTKLGHKNSCYLEIDNIKYPITQLTMTFGLNEIPQASVILAAGTDGKGQVSPVHLSDPGKDFKPAKIKLNLRGESFTGKKWANEEITIFDGRIAGSFSPRRSEKSLTISGTLIHWLADLAEGAATAANTAITNPEQMNIAHIANTAAGAYLPTGAIQEFIDENLAAKTYKDFDYFEFFRSLFLKLATSDKKIENVKFQNLCFPLVAKNPRAENALKKLNGSLKINDYLNNVSYYIKTRLINTLLKAPLNYYGKISVWDKLVNWAAAEYGIAVAPQIETATVIPDIPAYYRPGMQPWRIIDANSHYTAGFTTEMAKPILGVGVISTGAHDAFIGGATPTVTGCYTPEAKKINSESENIGTVVYIPGPNWMNLTAETGSSPLILGVAQEKIARNYAEYFYHQIALRGQVLSLAGRLRFDIAPGSIVYVLGISDKRVINAIIQGTKLFGQLFGTLATTLGKNHFTQKTTNRTLNKLNQEIDKAIEKFSEVSVIGYVRRVTINLNAENPEATTLFELSHVRSLASAESDRFSTQIHPLFTPRIDNHGFSLHPKLA